MSRTRRFVPRVLALVLVVGSLSVIGGGDEAAADPELVTLTAEPDRAAIEADTSTTMVVKIDLEAAARPEDATIGVNLGLLLDTSGSMAGEPIEQARAAVHALVDELRPIDRITIVTFDSRAQLVQPMTLIDDVDLDELHDRIDAIEARGTTDMAAGLGTLLQQLHGNPTVGDLDRIVLVSDGVPNDPSPIASQVENARMAGFAITTLGVGLEYDELLLGDMSRESGGKFHHVEHGEALGETVVAELVGAQRQVAGNVRLDLSTGPGVTLRRVIGHSPPIQAGTNGGHGYSIVLSELAEGEEQQVFVEVDVAPAKAGTTLELLDAIVSFDDRAAGSGRLERRAFVAMPVTGDRAVFAMRNAQVETGATCARAAAATIDAIALSRNGDIDAAEVLLVENEIALGRQLEANADDPENAPQMRRQGEQIEKMRAELKNYRPVPKPRGPGEALEGGEGERWYRVAKEANAASVDVLQAHE
jgi:Ca-activated chloride channel family protein